MRLYFLILIACAPFFAVAQPAPRTIPPFDSESLAAMEIGWTVRNKLDKETPTAKTVGKYRYHASQVGTAWNFLQWMQKDYAPKGYMGESKWYLNDTYVEKYPDNLDHASVQHSLVNALPQTYGAYTRFYAFLKYNAQQKLWPENNISLRWHIAANEIRTISQPLVFISDSSQYYFTMPRYFTGMKGEMATELGKDAVQFRGFDKHPALAQFMHYYIPGKIIDFEPWYVTIMTKDNQPLPFSTVTIGEVLTIMDKKLLFWYEATYHPDKPGERQKYVAGYFEGRLTTAKANMARLKEKYKDRWNEVAELAGISLDGAEINFSKLANGDDIPFGNNGVDKFGRSTFPVQKIKPEAMAACKTDGPQWIVLRWNGHTLNEPRYAVLMDHLLNDFNYQYLYDYYFGKEKVTAPYTTLEGKQPATGANAPVAMLSEAVAAAVVDKNTLFFDDFSGVRPGQSPANWAGQRNQQGNKVTVHEVKGTTGKWLRLQRYVYPTNWPATLAGDFSLSFDVMVEKGGTVYMSKGFEIGLWVDKTPDPTSGSTYGAKYVLLRVAPGDRSRAKAPGYCTVNAFLPEGYFTCKKDLYYYLPTFTGSEPINQVTLTLKRKGEQFSIWQNGNKLFECDKAIPAGLSFKNIRFTAYDEDSYYITNLSLSKN